MNDEAKYFSLIKVKIYRNKSTQAQNKNFIYSNCEKEKKLVIRETRMYIYNMFYNPLKLNQKGS